MSLGAAVTQESASLIPRRLGAGGVALTAGVLLSILAFTAAGRVPSGFLQGGPRCGWFPPVSNASLLILSGAGAAVPLQATGNSAPCRGGCSRWAWCTPAVNTAPSPQTPSFPGVLLCSRRRAGGGIALRSQETLAKPGVGRRAGPRRPGQPGGGRSARVPCAVDPVSRARRRPMRARQQRQPRVRAVRVSAFAALGLPGPTVGAGRNLGGVVLGSRHVGACVRAGSLAARLRAAGSPARREPSSPRLWYAHGRLPLAEEEMFSRLRKTYTASSEGSRGMENGSHFAA